MFYAGCGEDDDGGGAPGAGQPCDICPCNFFDVPMTLACWPGEPTPRTFMPGTQPDFACQLSSEALNFNNTTLTATEELDAPLCVIERSILGCTEPLINESTDSIQQQACRSCLEQYATELNQVLSVNPGPPYICAE